MSQQTYEDYWRLTVATTDIHAGQYNDTLRIIIDFVDENQEYFNSDEYLKNRNNRSKQYDKLQYKVKEFYKSKNKDKSIISIRKEINQYVKLGFVKPYFTGYHQDVKKFLRASSKKKRETYFSDIFYANASLGSASTVDKTNVNEIKFLMKTLQYHPDRKLTYNDVLSLMVTTNVSDIKKGYFTVDELEAGYISVKERSFSDRKYNQPGYIFDFMKYVNGVSVLGQSDERIITYTEIADEILPHFDVSRDQYRWRLTCEELYQESKDLYGKKVCYFTKKELPGLTASHIWRFSDAMSARDQEAAYDYKNTILIEKNTDQYFDTYKMTFDNEGNPIYSQDITQDYLDLFGDNKLSEDVLDEQRLEYLKEHHQKFTEKNNIPIGD